MTERDVAKKHKQGEGITQIYEMKRLGVTARDMVVWWKRRRNGPIFHKERRDH